MPVSSVPQSTQAVTSLPLGEPRGTNPPPATNPVDDNASGVATKSTGFPTVTTFIGSTPALTKLLGQSTSTVPQKPSLVAPRSAVVDRIDVVLDSSGSTGRVTADIPLSSFQPPLSPNDVADFVARVQLPANAAGLFTPSILDNNGQPALHVELSGVQVSQLRTAPMLIMLGKPSEMGQIPPPELVARGFKVVDAARFRLQIGTRNLHVDSTQPELLLERADRDKTVSSIAALQAAQAREQAVNPRGVLSSALDGAKQEAITADRALEQMRVKSEAVMQTGSPEDVVGAIPSDVDAPRTDLLMNAVTAVTPLQMVSAKKAIVKVYSELRAVHPDAADAWLAALDSQFASAVRRRSDAREQVVAADSALARFDKLGDGAEARGGELAALGQNEAKQNQAIADREQGRVSDMSFVATSYDPSIRLP